MIATLKEKGASKNILQKCVYNKEGMAMESIILLTKPQFLKELEETERVVHTREIQT